MFYTAAAFALTLMFAKAQPVLTNTGLFDDFSSENPPVIVDPATGFGLYWWGKDGQIALTPDPANKQLKVVMTQPAYQYNPFGVGFGDSNGDGTGTPNTIDISKNGTFSFDIKNSGTQGLQVRILAQDVNGGNADCIKGATAFGDIWKYQTQIQVPAGKTVKYIAGTPNGAGGGIMNNCDFTKSVWGDYGTHTIRTDFDLTKIKSINITVLNMEKLPSDGHALALTDGNFSISNFRVGDVPAAIYENKVKNENFSIVSNPANHSIIIKNNNLGNSSNQVQIINICGQIVYSGNFSSSVKEFVIDVNHLQTGIYFVHVGQQTQKLTLIK